DVSHGWGSAGFVESEPAVTSLPSSCPSANLPRACATPSPDARTPWGVRFGDLRGLFHPSSANKDPGGRDQGCWPDWDRRPGRDDHPRSLAVRIGATTRPAHL